MGPSVPGARTNIRYGVLCQYAQIGLKVADVGI